MGFGESPLASILCWREQEHTTDIESSPAQKIQQLF
jgi:hypothetical protein